MRGFPLLNLIAALLVSGLVILPLVHRATRVAARPRPAAAPAPDATASVNAHFSLRFVHAPGSITLSAGDRPLATLRPSGPETLIFSGTLPLPLTENRTEIQVDIRWPEGTPDTVAELLIEPDGREARSANIWSSGPVAGELVTFSWKGETP